MALAWLQACELGPLLMTGIAIVIGLTLFGRFMQRDWVQSFISVLRFVSVRDMPLGVVLSLVIGITSFSADLHPDVFAFWRSRPINPSVWFWTKFVSGAAVMTNYTLEQAMQAASKDGSMIAYASSFKKSFFALRS